MRVLGKNQGFTLVEMLVVMLIIAVMVGLAQVVWRTNPAKAWQADGEHLQVLLTAWQEEASMQGVPLGVQLDEIGFRFVKQDSQGVWRLWQDDVFHADKWSQPADIRVWQEGQLLTLGDTLLALPEGVAAFRIEASPQSPIHAEGQALQGWQIDANPVGVVSLSALP